MRALIRAGVAAVIAAALALPVSAQTATVAQLKAMLESEGYVPRTLGGGEATPAELQVELQSGGFTVPVALSLSRNSRYIWATIVLGPAANIAGPAALAMLKKNADIQPSSFYVSQNNLMLGYAIDNRAVTGASLKSVIEKLAADASSTQELWAAPQSGR